METTTLAISLYPCGTNFSVEHAPSCSCGGFPTAKLLTEVCHNVACNRAASTASNSEDRAILDVCAQGFWGDRHQRAFLMSGFSTLSHQATFGPPSHPLTDTMRLRKEDATKNGFGRLNMDRSLLLYSQPQGMVNRTGTPGPPHRWVGLNVSFST